MMKRHVYNDKIKALKAEWKAASPDEQIEIDFTIFGMRHAIGDNEDNEMHEKRMELFYSTVPGDKAKGKAYRKGMDIVLYSVVGKKKATGTTLLTSVRVSEDIERGLNNLQKHFKITTLSAVRRSALRWYIEMMSEKHGKDFFK